MENDLKAFGAVKSAQMAYYSAANVVSLLNDHADSLHWPTFGLPSAGVNNPLDTYVMRLADFVRMSGGYCSGEALYRFAGGKMIHDGEAQAFDALPFEFRAAYRMFGYTLREYDEMISDEIKRAIAAQIAEAPPPVAQALALPADETTLEMVGDPLEKIKLPPGAPIFPGKPAEPPAPVAEANEADDDELEHADADTPVYWINVIGHQAVELDAASTPPGAGWLKVDLETYTAFSADLAAKLDVKLDAAKAADAPAPAEGEGASSDGADEAKDEQGEDAGTVPKQARRRQQSA